ncbi:MAG: 23S rRNA (pseudouridine(1915)-N(3))-methyltransferase RlmH [Hyphomicrobiales bacterium]|nr:23S rRNA (pseudouridine(1915)-N(3))-methyltransferase RlmH [Hyphomicrobiales bacterium]
MKLRIIAVGRLKEDAEAVLVRRYAERLEPFARAIGIGPLTITEIAEARGEPALRKRAEGAEIMRLSGGIPIVALDEGGEALTSEELAQWLRRLRDDGCAGLAFAIGGADGHAAEVIAAARRSISLGRITLPHGLARAVLAEQLYRAATIIAGHPYHRA